MEVNKLEFSSVKKMMYQQVGIPVVYKEVQLLKSHYHGDRLVITEISPQQIFKVLTQLF